VLKNKYFNKFNKSFIQIYIMEGTPEFVSYKKLMIFGSEGTGKSSLVKRIERGSFTNEVHTENGK